MLTINGGGELSRGGGCEKQGGRSFIVILDGACGGDSDFCLGGGDGVLISKLSSLDETRCIPESDHLTNDLKGCHRPECKAVLAVVVGYRLSFCLGSFRRSPVGSHRHEPTGFMPVRWVEGESAVVCSTVPLVRSAVVLSPNALVLVELCKVESWLRYRGEGWYIKIFCDGLLELRASHLLWLALPLRRLVALAISGSCRSCWRSALRAVFCGQRVVECIAGRGSFLVPFSPTSVSALCAAVADIYDYRYYGGFDVAARRSSSQGELVSVLRWRLLPAVAPVGTRLGSSLGNVAVVCVGVADRQSGREGWLDVFDMVLPLGITGLLQCCVAKVASLVRCGFYVAPLFSSLSLEWCSIGRVGGVYRLAGLVLWNDGRCESVVDVRVRVISRVLRLAAVRILVGVGCSGIGFLLVSRYSTDLQDIRGRCCMLSYGSLYFNRSGVVDRCAEVPDVLWRRKRFSSYWRPRPMVSGGRRWEGPLWSGFLLGPCSMCHGSFCRVNAVECAVHIVRSCKVLYRRCREGCWQFQTPNCGVGCPGGSDHRSGVSCYRQSLPTLPPLLGMTLLLGGLDLLGPECVPSAEHLCGASGVAYRLGAGVRFQGVWSLCCRFRFEYCTSLLLKRSLVVCVLFVGYVHRWSSFEGYCVVLSRGVWGLPCYRLSPVLSSGLCVMSVGVVNAMFLGFDVMMGRMAVVSYSVVFRVGVVMDYGCVELCIGCREGLCKEEFKLGDGLKMRSMKMMIIRVKSKD
ncbi:hypothetical protein Tco_0323569 [Tanacetum coccineum]